MVNIVNNCVRHMDVDEMHAVLDCVKILETRLKCRVHCAYINADKDDKESVHDVAFVFDKWSIQ